MVEERANHTPAEVDVDTGRGEHARASKDERCADIAPDRSRPLPSNEPCQNRCDSANKPEPLKGGVDGAVAEDSGRANSSPNNGGRVENTTARARVVVGLIIMTDIGDVSQCPVHNANLYNGGPDGRNQLR